MADRPFPPAIRSVAAAAAIAWLAGPLACATPAPPVDLPPLGAVSSIALDPACSGSSCPPRRDVRDPAEIAFRLALLHALNKDWRVADERLCPGRGPVGRATYQDAEDRSLLVVWEHASSSRIQLAIRDADAGCQATPRWSLDEYASAMEAARRLYGRMLQEGSDATP